MNKIFYLPMLILMVVIPFFLVEFKKEKTDKVEFVKSTNTEEKRDTIKLYELIDDNWEVFFVNFDIIRNKATFSGDTINFTLNAGFFGGYNLSIRVIGDEFTSQLTKYDCTSSEDLRIGKQALKLEDFELLDKNKLKGEIYCETKYVKSNAHVKKVKIIGYFEMDLVDSRIRQSKLCH